MKFTLFSDVCFGSNGIYKYFLCSRFSIKHIVTLVIIEALKAIVISNLPLWDTSFHNFVGNVAKKENTATWSLLYPF